MVLMVVDTQKGIVDERLYAFEKFVSNIRELIRTAREQGIEVVYVQHDDGPGTGFSIGDDEFEVYSGFAPLLTENGSSKPYAARSKRKRSAGISDGKGRKRCDGLRYHDGLLHQCNGGGGL